MRKSNKFFQELLNKKLIETEQLIMAKVTHLLTFGDNESSKKLMPEIHSSVKLQVLYYVRGLSYPVHELVHIFTYKKAIQQQHFDWFGIDLKATNYPYYLKQGKQYCPKLNLPTCYLFDELIWEGVAPEDVHQVSQVWFTLTYHNHGQIELDSTKNNVV